MRAPSERRRKDVKGFGVEADEDARHLLDDLGVGLAANEFAIKLESPQVHLLLRGMQKIAKLRLEEARIRLGGAGDPGEFQALRNEVEAMRGELNELQERVDFAERMLAQGRDRTALKSEN